MTQSPSPSVDEVADLPPWTETEAWLVGYIVDLKRTPNGFAEEIWELEIILKRLRAASLVSPPKAVRLADLDAVNADIEERMQAPPKAGAGEPVGFRWRMSASDHWSQPHAIELLPSTLNDGREIQYLYASHEARGDGVRVTAGPIGGQSLEHIADLGPALRRIHASGAVTSELLEAAMVLEAIALLPPLGDGRAEIVEALKALVHQPNPTDPTRWDVAPGKHRQFSELMASIANPEKDAETPGNAGVST